MPQTARIPKLLLNLSIVALVGLAPACQQHPAAVAARTSPTEVAVTPPISNGKHTVLVAYYSRSGNTEKMAKAVEEGAGEVEGVSVVLKPIADVTKADLDAAHGVVLGSATHFANIPTDMKAAIDQWAWKDRVNFTDKVGGAFSTGGNLTGGKEHVVISLLLYMLNNRMMVVGPICKEGDGGWGEIGASATTGGDDPGLSEAELTGARRLGRRVAQVVARTPATDDEQK